MATSGQSHFPFISHFLCNFASDCIIAIQDSLSLRIIYTLVYYVQESTRIWNNLLPSASEIVIGSLVPDEASFIKSYRFCICCLDDASMVLKSTRGGR